VFNDFKLSLQTVVQLNGVIEEQTNSVAVWQTRLVSLGSFFVLKFTCLTVGLLYII